jgi:hypothetical protein
MGGLEIAALVAMIASAGVQYKASTDAQERQQREIQASLEAQRNLQMQAENKATTTAAEYETPKRSAEQAAIAEQLTQELIAPVSESQAIRAEQQTTQGDVSNDYTTAKASSDLNTLKSAEALARMLGKTSSAGRLRMNEGIRLTDSAQDIDRLAGFSRGQQGADNIAIQQAGQLDAGKVFAGQLLGAAGSAGLMYGGGNAALTAGDTAAANASADPIGALASMKSARLAAPNFAARMNTGANGLYRDFSRAFQ